mgnify:FL=1
MNHKKTFYTELAYVIGVIVLAFGTALMERVDFGVSMVVAPAYLIHLKMSQFYNWFSFGVAEYSLQLVIIIITAIVCKKFKPMYLFAFVTALFYGTVLDLCIKALLLVDTSTIWFRLILYIAGEILCTFGVSLLFKTYFAPEAYELFVKEFSAKYNTRLSVTKWVYDCSSCAVAILMSFIFFGFGNFEGVKIGTVICALVNGLLIGRWLVLEDYLFEFKDKLPLGKYFK